MCLAALPLALGGNAKDAAISAISPALGIMSALGRKKKPAAPVQTMGIPA